MTDQKVWLITGAGRCMGVDLAKAALAVGDAVLASGRNPERVSSALGAHDDLLVESMNGLQGGDPAKLAVALVQLASQAEPPVRFMAAADAVAAVEQKAKHLLAQADAYRELSSDLAHAAA